VTVRNGSEDLARKLFGKQNGVFGMVLRDSPHKGNATLERALEWAKEDQGIDQCGYRQEFVRLIHRAITLSE
jgi:Ca-activated chloride channel family protein